MKPNKRNSDRGHYPKDPEFDKTDRNIRREQKKELKKFRVKINCLGGIYSKVVKTLSDSDVRTLQSRYYSNQREVMLGYKKSVKLNEIVDEWLRNSDEAVSTFRNLKLELLLDK